MPPPDFQPPAQSVPGEAHRPPRGSVSDGFYLVKKSWVFLRQEPRMLALPVCSAASVLILAAVLYPPIVLMAAHHRSRFVIALLFTLASIPLTAVSTFFNVAFVATIQTRLRGGKPSLRSGLARARWRLPQILGWSIAAAAVGLVMRILENVAGGSLVTRIAEAIGGLLWRAAIFFVVPVIALEGYGPLDSIRYSARVFKQRFGTALTGTLTISFVFAVAMLPGAVVAGLGLAALVAHRPSTAIPTLAVGFCLIAVPLIASQAVSSIFRVALYRQATEGRLVGPFDEDDLARAIRPRKRRR